MSEPHGHAMDAAAPSELPESVDFAVDGQQFTLRLFADPSGLRGQVFDGEEKVAGIQVFHTTEVQRLVALARRDQAVLRAVARRAAEQEP